MIGAVQLPDDLAPVEAALRRSLERVTERFDAQLESDLGAVSDLMAQLGGYRGKMLRPSLVLLFAMAAGDQSVSLDDRVSEEHVIAGAVVEMVHMATLVHDDVLDEAELRRRSPTISHLRGNEAAVILGDYLIAAAYELCSQIGDQRTSLAVARASMTVCAGELLQLSHRGDLALDEDTYFAIIDRKTAELVALSCSLGARHAGASEGVCEAAGSFGRLLGQAFQIQDDVLDLVGEEGVVGKSVGRDSGMGKLTLPMIRHRESPGGRTRLRELISAIGSGDHEAGGRLRDELIASGAVERAQRDAADLVEQARKGLGTLPASDARRTLDLVAQSVIRRAF